MAVKDKVVVITGAAGQLGQVVVRRFAEAGAKVAPVDRAADRLGQLYADLPDALLVSGIDVTDPDASQRMAETVVRERGRIDVLLNIAGGWRGGKPLHEVGPDEWDFVMSLNAKSVFLSCRAVIPAMIQQGAGRIISVAAKSGLEGKANTALYNASKSAVIRLTEAMAAELKEYSVTVNCLLPTIIDTPQNREQMPKSDFSKWITPDQMADTMLFLASDAASAITGAAIVVNGRV